MGFRGGGSTARNETRGEGLNGGKAWCQSTEGREGKKGLSFMVIADSHRAAREVAGLVQIKFTIIRPNFRFSGTSSLGQGDVQRR